MSPEAHRNKVDYKSDMWSMGCILYEFCMLKGAFRVLGEIFDGPVPKIDEMNPDISTGENWRDLRSIGKHNYFCTFQT